MEVTPHINSSGDVQLRVHVESSTLDTQQILNAPVFDTQQFRTDLTAKHGQTLVLGGIIQRQISDTVHKTVILGDIPGLRWAFRKKDKSTQRVQLMVFLHPTVIHTPEDAQSVLQHINDEAPQMKKMAGRLRQRDEEVTDLLRPDLALVTSVLATNDHPRWRNRAPIR